MSQSPTMRVVHPRLACLNPGNARKLGNKKKTSLTLGWALKYEKNTEKIRNCQFFSHFLGPTWGGGFRFFFFVPFAFFRISGIQGFVGSVRGPQVRKPRGGFIPIVQDGKEYLQ